MPIVVDMPREEEELVREAAAGEGVDVSTFLREAAQARLRPALLPHSMSEPELLAKITEGFPEAFWRRFRALAAKRDAGTLTPAEREELIAHSDRTEFRDAERLTYLADLSRRRGVPVRALMDEMGLRPVRVS